MNTLSAKIALLLGTVFAVSSVLVMALAHGDETGLLPATATLACIGAALFAVWCLLLPLTRRLARLVGTLDTLARGGATTPLRLSGADANGDELARMAAQAERVSEQLAGQAATLARGVRQRRELLANVSHDLRTPLASMQGYLELLLLRHGSLEPAEAQNYLQTAARQSERLARLVGDLFELTQLEADDVAPVAEPFALAELAHDVTQKFASDAARREVTLATRCDAAAASAGAVIVQADIGMIERVLDNLVDNALRHTPAGGAVTIEIDRREARACMCIRDTGEGIAAEDMPGLFERYERSARVGPASTAGHAGLGLAIARRIVHLHGSQLQVDSARGLGTRVSFELALAERRSH